MLPFLTLFIIFVLILAYYRKKSNAAQAEAEERFWTREHEANSTRRKDISELNYITIPVEKLPLDMDTESTQRILMLSDKKMLNLTQYTNTIINKSRQLLHGNRHGVQKKWS